MATVTQEAEAGDGAPRADSSRGTLHRRWAGLTTLTALAVDPDRAAVRGLHTAFSQQGVDLIVCDDGAEALFQVGRLTPGLVLLRPIGTRLSAADVVRIIGPT